MLENPMHMMNHKSVKCHLQNGHIFLQKFHQDRYSKNLKCNVCYLTNIIKITTTLMAMKLPLISTPILYGLFITTHSYSILIQCWIVTAVLLCSALPNSVTTPGASHPITLP